MSLPKLYQKWKIKPAEKKQMASLLVKQYKQSYERNLSNELRKLGKRNRVKLENKVVLKSLQTQANRDLNSIAKTYNKELLHMIRANKQITSVDLEDWTLKRDIWKAEQIALHTEMEAKARAKSDFIRRNKKKLRGQAFLKPSKYGDSICQSLLAKNPYSLEQASSFRIPHLNCVHYMDVKYVKVDEDVDLWYGQEGIVRHLPGKHNQVTHGKGTGRNLKAKPEEILKFEEGD